MFNVEFPDLSKFNAFFRDFPDQTSNSIIFPDPLAILAIVPLVYQRYDYFIQLIFIIIKKGNKKTNMPISF